MPVEQGLLHAVKPMHSLNIIKLCTADTHTNTCTHVHARTHARTHAHTHTHTQSSSSGTASSIATPRHRPYPHGYIVLHIPSLAQAKYLVSYLLYVSLANIVGIYDKSIFTQERKTD